jgi:hypothetical protein
MFISFVEHFLLEKYFDKTNTIPFSLLISSFGLLMMIVGHYFRIGAMFTAG